MTVSAAAEQALQEALDRLAAGRPVRTDEALTVAGLAAEAGVSRSTANRATSVLTGLRLCREFPELTWFPGRTGRPQTGQGGLRAVPGGRRVPSVGGWPRVPGLEAIWAGLFDRERQQLRRAG